MTMSTPEEAESIRKLLESTGWSCDDLLKKLQNFRNVTEPSNNASQCNATTNIEQNQDSSNKDGKPDDTSLSYNLVTSTFQDQDKSELHNQVLESLSSINSIEPDSSENSIKEENNEININQKANDDQTSIAFEKFSHLKKSEPSDINSTKDKDNFDTISNKFEVSPATFLNINSKMESNQQVCMLEKTSLATDITIINDKSIVNKSVQHQDTDGRNGDHNKNCSAFEQSTSIGCDQNGSTDTFVNSTNAGVTSSNQAENNNLTTSKMLIHGKITSKQDNQDKSKDQDIFFDDSTSTSKYPDNNCSTVSSQLAIREEVSLEQDDQNESTDNEIVLNDPNFENNYSITSNYPKDSNSTMSAIAESENVSLEEDKQNEIVFKGVELSPILSKYTEDSNLSTSEILVSENVSLEQTNQNESEDLKRTFKEQKLSTISKSTSDVLITSSNLATKVSITENNVSDGDLTNQDEADDLKLPSGTSNLHFSSSIDLEDESSNNKTSHKDLSGNLTDVYHSPSKSESGPPSLHFFPRNTFSMQHDNEISQNLENRPKHQDCQNIAERNFNSQSKSVFFSPKVVNRSSSITDVKTVISEPNQFFDLAITNASPVDADDNSKKDVWKNNVNNKINILDSRTFTDLLTRQTDSFDFNLKLKSTEELNELSVSGGEHCFEKPCTQQDCDESSGSKENLLLLSEESRSESLASSYISDDLQNQCDPISQSTNETNAHNDITSEAQEEIRRNLKLQISCLRNRRKSTNVIEDDSSKIRTLGKIKSSYKKSYTNHKRHLSLIPPTNEINKKESKVSVTKSSNMADIKIVNVVGGVDFDDHLLQQNELCPKTIKNSEKGIRLTKTNDFTKIKGWQHKKFMLQSTESTKAGVIQESTETLKGESSETSSLKAIENIRKIISNRGKRKSSYCETQTSTPNSDSEKSNDHSDSSHFAKKSRIEDEGVSNNKSNLSTNMQDNSPFVSNSLEEFLSENSELNISYKIPKLGAEEALSKENPMCRSPVLRASTAYNNSLSNTQNTELNKNGSDEKMPKHKPKTLAEKRKLLEGYLVSAKSKKGFDRKLKNNLHKNSYIVYDSTKIKVTSLVRYKCLGEIKIWSKKDKEGSSNDNNLNSPTRKLSLLQDLRQKHDVNFMPGPLSKKPSLCKSDEWISEVKKLPSVSLEVLPEFGKRIPPELEHLVPSFDELISKDHANYALTALYTKLKTPPETFFFPVPYKNNQQHILVLKKKPKFEMEIDVNIKPEKNSVASVIDDLLTYVETKELGNTMIKDAEVYKETDIIQQSTSGCVNSNVSIVSTARTNRKIYLELQRLNCKVVNVKLDIPKEKENCTNSYCQMGCVCNSIQSKFSMPLHCGKLNCMFLCKCKSQKLFNQVTLSADEELLSKDTVERLDHQAKRNLAKFEREMTQTIIQTGDKTIFVGDRKRKSQRRAARAPKKYTDFTDEFDSDDTSKRKILPTSSQPVEKAIDSKYNCYVHLEKLNFIDQIVPLCMEHKSYNCDICIHSPGEDKQDSDNGSELDTNSFQFLDRLSKEVSARTLPVFAQYIERNRTKLYATKLRQKMKNFAGDIRYIKKEEIDGYINVVDDGKSRKSSLDSVKNYDLDYKTDTTFRKPNSLCESVFEGEIVVPTVENMDFVKKLGVKNVSEYMRLLPWNDLLRNYYNGKIQIWCCKQQTSRLLMNTSNKSPPPNYIEIAKATTVTGIIQWILTKTLPRQTPIELVHLILSQYGGHYEISGICLKNLKTDKGSKRLRPEKAKLGEGTRRDSNDIKLRSNLQILKHKNVENEMNVLVMTEHAVPEQILNLTERSPIDEANKKFPIGVKLPSIHQKDRWRMLYLNSNFTYLSFINNKYSIKYTDLMLIVKKAQEHKKTISLESVQLSEGYSSKHYGIYAVPEYRDRLFIGPYKENEPHGLETLRYLRQSLVSTTIFDNLLGNMNKKTAVWLKQISNFEDKTVKDTETIISNLKLTPVTDLPCISKVKPSVGGKPTTRSKSNSLESKGAVEDKNESKLKIRVRTDLTDVNSSNVIIDLDEAESTKSKKAGLNIFRDINRRLSIDAISKNDDMGNNDKIDHSISSRSSTSGSDSVSNAISWKSQILSDNTKIMEPYHTFTFNSNNTDEKTFVKFPQFVLLNGKQLAPSDFNRFIITNIPNFGYFGAQQKDDSKVLDVDWPFEHKILRFSEEKAATAFLTRRLSNLLLTVPESFRIQLVVLKETDPILHTPVDIKCLSGTYVCGPFGVIDSKTMSQSRAVQIGTTQDEVLERLARRAQYLGASEIKKLQAMERNYVAMKKELKMRKHKNLTKYMSLISVLPETEKFEHYMRLKEIFNVPNLQPSNLSKHDKEPDAGVQHFLEKLTNLTDEVTATSLPGTSISMEDSNKNKECIVISDSDDEKPPEEPPAKKVKVVSPAKVTSPESLKTMQTSPIKIKVLKNGAVTTADIPLPSEKKASNGIIDGYNFVKTASGKLVLTKIPNKTPNTFSVAGTRMTILNNQVVSRKFLLKKETQENNITVENAEPIDLDAEDDIEVVEK